MEQKNQSYVYINMSFAGWGAYMHFPGKQGHYYTLSKSNIILETIRPLKKTNEAKISQKTGKSSSDNQ